MPISAFSANVQSEKPIGALSLSLSPSAALSNVIASVCLVGPGESLSLFRLAFENSRQHHRDLSLELTSMRDDVTNI